MEGPSTLLIALLTNHSMYNLTASCKNDIVVTTQIVFLIRINYQLYHQQPEKSPHQTLLYSNQDHCIYHITTRVWCDYFGSLYGTFVVY